MRKSRFSVHASFAWFFSLAIALGGVLSAAAQQMPAGVSMAAFRAMGQLPFLFAEPKPSGYRITGTCDGLPRVDLKTPPGMCVGLVAEKLSFPRGVAQLSNGDLLVTEMVGWGSRQGRVTRFRRLGASGPYEKTVLISGLDQVHGIVVGPDGLPYVGEGPRIFRFTPDQPQHRRVVVDGLPNTGRHPLKALAFDRHGALLVNIGSSSDNCEGAQNAHPDPSKPCVEGEGKNGRGVIRRYVLDGPNRTARDFQVVAYGLRNSMAMEVVPGTSFLLQAENSRDSIERRDTVLSGEELPHDEINVINLGSIDWNSSVRPHYGWPYCYDQGQKSPEYPFHGGFCQKSRKPWLLLPAHSAPLGMALYSGETFPNWYRGKLIVGLHGYRKYGHRLVIFNVDSRGLPTGDPFDLIWDWEARGTQKQGAPVSVISAEDGSVILTEDKTGTVLRLFYDRTKGDGLPRPGSSVGATLSDPGLAQRCAELQSKTDLFSIFQRKVIDRVDEHGCIQCHGGASGGAAGGLLLKQCDARGNAERLLETREAGAIVKACDPLSPDFSQSSCACPRNAVRASGLAARLSSLPLR